MAWDDPQVSVGGILGLRKGRKSSFIILSKYGEELRKNKKELRQKNEEEQQKKEEEQHKKDEE